MFIWNLLYDSVYRSWIFPFNMYIKIVRTCNFVFESVEWCDSAGRKAAIIIEFTCIETTRMHSMRFARVVSQIFDNCIFVENGFIILLAYASFFLLFFIIEKVDRRKRMGKSFSLQVFAYYVHVIHIRAQYEYVRNSEKKAEIRFALFSKMLARLFGWKSAPSCLATHE